MIQIWTIIDWVFQKNFKLKIQIISKWNCSFPLTPSCTHLSKNASQQLWHFIILIPISPYETVKTFANRDNSYFIFAFPASSTMPLRWHRPNVWMTKWTKQFIATMNMTQWWFLTCSYNFIRFLKNIPFLTNPYQVDKLLHSGNN